MQTNIQPTVFYKPAVKAKLDYVTVEVTEENWGRIRVLFLDDENRAIAAQDVPMTLEESESWAGDDSYVLMLALQKLGISTV